MTFDLNSATFDGNIYAENLDDKGFTSSVVKDKFQVSSINSGNAGSIFSSGCITNTQITAESITADELAANSITTEKIAKSTIDGGELQAGIITNLKIENSTIEGTSFSMGSVTASKIQSYSIDASKISTQTLEANVTKSMESTVDTYETEAFSVGGSLTVPNVITARLSFTTINGNQFIPYQLPDKDGKMVDVILWNSL